MASLGVTLVTAALVAYVYIRVVPSPPVEQKKADSESVEMPVLLTDKHASAYRYVNKRGVAHVNPNSWSEIKSPQEIVDFTRNKWKREDYFGQSDQLDYNPSRRNTHRMMIGSAPALINPKGVRTSVTAAKAIEEQRSIRVMRI